MLATDPTNLFERSSPSGNKKFAAQNNVEGESEQKYQKLSEDISPFQFSGCRLDEEDRPM